jgi:chloramphenicol-sensitive protein RarD
MNEEKNGEQSGAKNGGTRGSHLSERGVGIIYAVLAYLVWGFLPLYWKLLDQVPAQEILAHRILWSFIFVSGILVGTGGVPRLKAILANRKNTLLLLACAVIISLNWYTYIWAVNAGHLVEASMGYYINPLLTVMLAIIVLKEKLGFWQGKALMLAAVGVVIMTVHYGRIPWVALILAITFAIYSLIKRVIKVDSVSGLALETALVMPLALIFIVLKEIQGTGALGTVTLPVLLLLFGSGIATATPLLWFAKGAQRVELVTIGFLQYLAPTISLWLGIFIFKEQFTLTHLISFGFIWLALLIYSLAKVGLLKNRVTTLYEETLAQPVDQKAL